MNTMREEKSFEKGVETLKAQIDARVLSYLSSCVHCGVCADACLFYTETGDPRYAWVNRTVFVGTGIRRASAVEVALFAVE